ncbi:metallophosphoesterase [Virgibacillus byunsanensis]|uniref:Metallophosphoesterase n=1 Tax=Virgibacillus byunsanensis TaxID=570945 RepID=A0ABW3LQE2_9BACI
MVSILIVMIVLVVYIIWDNNRITTVEQDIVIDDLPESLDGFRILQVTDLHEKQFGENQKRLINSINEVDYDAIIFTGDMLDSTESANYDPFYSLLNGINNKENAWYTPGNTDPYNYQFNPEIKKSEFIIGMEERGVKLLESMDTVTVDGADIHVVNFELSILRGADDVGRTEGIVRPSYVSDEAYLDYQRKLLTEVNMLDELTDSDLLIALNHYPVVDARIDHIQNNARTVLRDFDLLIAGHYHGGQIRLPILGALFIPEPWYNSNFLPPKERVKGLWEYKNMKQYVSTGLGSSDVIPFLKFRLFNPPQINILNFKR